MSTAALLLAESLSDLHLKDFLTETQDSGKVKLGGGFSPLSKLPRSKTRQPVKGSDPDIISKALVQILSLPIWVAPIN
jgi:hypothetical protein